MLVNICSYGTALSSTVEPGLACWNPSMALRKPASSASVPQVVKVRASVDAEASEPEVEKPAQPATAGIAAAATEVARKRRRVKVMARPLVV